MAFQLPRLPADIDCGPIGYPGLVVRFWLNPDREDWEPPENGPEWETPFYHWLARVVEWVDFPPEMSDQAEGEKVEIPDGKALYDLMESPGFDQTIILWAQSQYQEQRAERLEASVKN